MGLVSPAGQWLACNCYYCPDRLGWTSGEEVLLRPQWEGTESGKSSGRTGLSLDMAGSKLPPQKGRGRRDF